MAAQTDDKDTENDVGPAPSTEPHPLASVMGSFRNDLAFLDAVMAGVEKYRQRMEAEEDPSPQNTTG